MNEVVLAIDLGTGSVKTGLVGIQGEIAAQASQRYAVTAPRPGWSETNPREWWAAVVSCVREMLGGIQPQRVRAVSFSGQMHGVVLCSASGEPLRDAVLWSDSRSAAQLQTYAGLSPALLQRLRNPPVTGFAGPSLLWLCQHETAIYNQARWALQPKDWLRLYLTGVAASEPSDASGTLLYDLTRSEWDSEVLETLQLRPSLLPPLQSSGGVAGTLKPARALELGLPAYLPVVAGAADTAAALLGSGVQAGETQLTVGTGAQIVLLADRLPAARQALHVFRGAEQGFYTLAAVQNAGLVLEWVRRTLRLSWPEMYAAAQEIDGQGTPIFLPYLTGDRTPHLDPQARAGWVNLEAAHDWRHMAYAAFEGVALSIAQATATLDLPADQALKLAGGGSLNPWWQQLLADAVGRELWPTSTPAASLLGAARLAWRGLGSEMNAVNNRPKEKVSPQQARIHADKHAAFWAAYRPAGRPRPT